MRKHRIVEIGIVVAIVAMLAAILLPGQKRSVSPAWGSDAHKFLSGLKKPLSDYASRHGGRTPNSLGDLYPDYTSDKRVLQPVVECRTERLGVVYYRPEKLGSPDTPVVEIRLPPGSKRDRPPRSIVLWGDMTIGFPDL